MFRGERLADIRKYEGLSQKELAGILVVEPNTISAYENGITTPSLTKIVKMAKYFNISTDYFLGIIDQKIPYDRKDVVILPKGFPKELIPKVREYIDLLMKSSGK